MVRIAGANSRRTKIQLELPVDEHGAYAFDEDDNPIEGRTPVTLVLPRFNYMPFDDLKALVKAAADIDERELSDDYNIMDRSRDSILATLRPIVDDNTYELLCRLTFGELQDINDTWSRESNTPLGESRASNSSSTNTRRPSNTTSSG